MHIPALNYLCSAERWLSPSEKQRSFQPVQQEAYLHSLACSRGEKDSE